MNLSSAESWFTAVDFRNASSPRHPISELQLDANHVMKQQLMNPWIRKHVKGKSVLDLFCANGVFSVESALAGAKRVVGIDFSPERVECARFLASVIEDRVDCSFDFVAGDVYNLSKLVSESFDVVLMLGGLYHIADPPHILAKVRGLAKERLIVQTSSILPASGNWAKFVVRRDRTDQGLTSVRGGHGVWFFTVECFQSILTHAGFQILEERQPQTSERERFPWYCALAKPLR